MLTEAKAYLETTGMENWSLAQADNRHMPIASNVADVGIEGWSFGHVMGWHLDDWQARTDQMLAEMERIAKPNGTAILIETMGTGQRQPQPPTEELAMLYDYWQAQHGFAYRWIRTDYQFASVDEADELTRFFFGDGLADELVASGRVTLPECTGIWWKHYGE
jgi:ubiquinone/menaquinone biosynthesis C-methylase UbiE